MTQKKIILVVDDDPLVLHVINKTMHQDFTTRIANNVAQALVMVALPPSPDLVLLDVSMPGADGYQLCATLKNNPATAEIPVIFLSSHDSVEEITRGLELGAVDYIAKPVIPSIVMARVRTHLRLRESKELLEHHSENLEKLVHERTQALQEQTDKVVRMQELTLVALGSLAETRDNETGNHIFRTQTYVKLLADGLMKTDYFLRNGVDYETSEIWKSAPLHDIGKVGIPDSILLKPGKLSAEEFEIMKRHTRLGREALESAERRMGIQHSFLRIAVEIVYCHHERWDGHGYPEGIAGHAIPVSARLMALADVYDALVNKRVYKEPMTHEEAVAIIRDQRSAHFDPDVVDCFVDLADKCREVALRFRD